MMPIMWLPFLLLSAVEAQQGTSNVVKPGFWLTTKTNASIGSPSGRYAFGFYEQGNGYAVGIFLAGLKTVVWTANRDSPPVPADIKLVFTTDGRLVLQSAQGQETLLDFSSERASSASMLDSGNFVLYGSANQILWQSFDHPTDTLLPTQNLTKGQMLSSSLSKSNQTRGKFLLLMQEDGVLAMYPVGTPSTEDYGYWSSVDWSSVSEGKALPAVEGGILTLDDNGNLYLFSGTGTDTQNLASGNSTKVTELLYRLTIDPDGILRLYSHDMTQTGNWTVAWSRPDDGCAPKGLCGLNEYCDLNPAVDCICLPGFAPVEEGDSGSGCKRDFSVEKCSESSKYTMKESNTAWENDTYSIFTSSTKENCRDACLQDCNCEAALFKDGKCTKRRLPLRFGRKDTSGSIAFIKVGTSTLPKEGKKFLIIGFALVVFAFMVLAISGFGIYKNHVRMSKSGNIELGEDVAPKSFTYAQLENATRGFSKELGSGASGTVYEGEMSIGQTKEIVAVKRLDRSVLAERADRHFHAEMKVIGRTHHKNLVCLLGYCHDGLHRLLVYKYMSNGSLADKLFTPERQLSWNERMEIARSIARGLIYLHEECEPQIIHCDIKPRNILIGKDGCAKICDFGLAKLLAQTKTVIETRGTQGYIAPEWRQQPSMVTDKVDVYSFGIVMLEIISCRKSMDSNLPDEEVNLKKWANHCFDCGELGKLVNNEEIDKRELEKMVKIGLWCTSDEFPLRPSMKKVLHVLEGIENIPESASSISSLISF